MKDAGSGAGWDHGGWNGNPRPDMPVLDTSTTVNPFGPPFSFEHLLSGIREGISRYPDPWGREAAEALSRRFGVSGDGIVFGPGATALLYRWVETVRPKRMVLFEPIFSEFGRAAACFGIPVLRVPPADVLSFKGSEPPGVLRRWKIDLSAFRERLRPGDHAVIVNPVNPTGQELSAETLRDFWERAGVPGAGLLVDESFQDFIGNRSSVMGSGRMTDPAWTILRSLTKITGLPGIRTGCLVTDPAWSGPIRSRMGPWSTGVIEQAVGVAWSRSGEEEAGRVRTLFAARKRFLEGWSAAGRGVFEGVGPFLWLHSGWGADARDLKDRIFRETGVYLRIGNGFGPGGGEHFLRVGFMAFREPGKVLEILLDRGYLPVTGFGTGKT